MKSLETIIQEITDMDRFIRPVSRARARQCKAASERYFKESGEDEFEPHACKRGSTEEA